MIFDELSSSILKHCRTRGLTIVTAESCTGGLIAASLTEIAGSSDVVWGGFVTYANEAKAGSLGVPLSLIEGKGAVSEEVVAAMVTGALERSGASLAVAVSGIAGPGGGSPDKPVGTVWIAAGRHGETPLSQLFHFTGNRSQIREETVSRALLLCEKLILSSSSLDSEQH
ncbi:MAG: nicotinamide-nucleotide amidohydrolase family protein [Spirochaetales bacterium]|nr:nicotinamide-nucleotide amidohydrolase family protein [Spirochaetales bacterium]